MRIQLLEKLYLPVTGSLIIDIKQDMSILDRRNIRKVNAGESIVAFGTLLFPSGACDHLAVKSNGNPMGLRLAGKPETV